MLYIIYYVYITSAVHKQSVRRAIKQNRISNGQTARAPVTWITFRRRNLMLEYVLLCADRWVNNGDSNEVYTWVRWICL